LKKRSYDPDTTERLEDKHGKYDPDTKINKEERLVDKRGKYDPDAKTIKDERIVDKPANDPFSKTSTKDEFGGKHAYDSKKRNLGGSDKHDPNGDQVVVAVDTNERLVIDNDNVPPKKSTNTD